MKFSIKSILVLFLLFAVFTEADAQSRKRRKSRTRTRGEVKEEKPSFSENLNYEIKFGNIGFGNSFSIALKPSVGYKFHKIASAGVGSRFAYTFINQVGTDDLSFFDYGFFTYGRVKLGSNFYLQGEYSSYSFDFATRENIFYPLFGGGYVSGFGDWMFGTELLFIGSDRARDNFNSVIEWWISASYRF